MCAHTFSRWGRPLWRVHMLQLLFVKGLNLLLHIRMQLESLKHPTCEHSCMNSIRAHTHTHTHTYIFCSHFIYLRTVQSKRNRVEFRNRWYSACCGTHGTSFTPQQLSPSRPQQQRCSIYAYFLITEISFPANSELKKIYLVIVPDMMSGLRSVGKY